MLWRIFFLMFFIFSTTFCLAFSSWSVLVHEGESWNGAASKLPRLDWYRGRPRDFGAVTLRKPDLTVWVISKFSHREQGHEGEEIATITGLRPASFLSCPEYNHFHNIKQSYLVTRSLETFPSHLYASFFFKEIHIKLWFIAVRSCWIFTFSLWRVVFVLQTQVLMWIV